MSEFNFTVLNNTYIFDVPGYNYAIFIKAKDNNQKNLPQATYITEQTALKIIDEKIEDDIKYVQVKMENSKTGWLEKEQLSIRQKSCEICEESKIDNSNLPISPEMQQKILNTNVFIAPPLKMTYNRNGRLENVNCPNYISSSDGSYGDIGNLLVKEITGQGHSTDRWNYFNSNEIPGLEEICPNFNYIKIFQDGLYDENIIYCKNILLHSFPQIKEKGKFAIELNNHFLNFLNHLSTRGKHISQKLSAYEMLFKLVISVIKEECAKDETSELCILKSSFNKHEKSLVKAMKMFNINSKPYDQMNQIYKNFKPLMI